MEDFERNENNTATDNENNEAVGTEPGSVQDNAGAVDDLPENNEHPTDTAADMAETFVADDSSYTVIAQDTVSDNNPDTDTASVAPVFKYSTDGDSKKEQGKNSFGTKCFVLVLAFIIVITGSLSIGYYLGYTGSSGSKNSYLDVELAQKPVNTDEMTEAQVYEKLNKSIVGIRVYNSKGAYVDASGVIYTENGYIISNDHIYQDFGAPKFKVYLYDGTEYDAEYVAGDKVSDLCVLKIDVTGLEPAEFGDSTKLFCGEHVVAVGRPSNATDDSSITSGVISLPKRRVKNSSNYTSSYIQTDSAINPGSSGGALANMYGQVLGITTSKLAGVQYDAVGFALPSATMKRVAEDMIENGRVTKRAKLGITYTEITSVYVEIGEYESCGLYLASVTNDSDLYGKVNEGDIITHVNGKKITKDTVILDVIEESLAGDTITLTILQNGVSRDYEVKLQANFGESSYNPLEENTTADSQEEESNGSAGSFDFPFGN